MKKHKQIMERQRNQSDNIPKIYSPEMEKIHMELWKTHNACEENEKDDLKQIIFYYYTLGIRHNSLDGLSICVCVSNCALNN